MILRPCEYMLTTAKLSHRPFPYFGIRGNGIILDNNIYVFFFSLSVDGPITAGVGACNTVEGLLAAVYDNVIGVLLKNRRSEISGRLCSRRQTDKPLSTFFAATYWTK